MRVISATVAGACVLASIAASPLHASVAQIPRGAPIAVHKPGASSASISPAVYASTIDRLATQVEALDEADPSSAETILNTLPPVWHVTLGDRVVDVSTDWLRQDLTTWQGHPDSGLRAKLVQHLHSVGAEATSADTPGISTAGARSTLETILAQREFHNVRGPSAFQLLFQRIVRWLLRTIGVAVTSSTMSTVTSVLVYGLIGMAVVLVALVMYRSIRYGTALEPIHLEPGLPPVAAISFDDARRAAEHGDWRGAVHLAYWSGIQLLEARGTWRPDRARTPREYLRLLPPGSVQAAPLRALTTLIERVWYAGELADASRFDEAVAHLKALGCLHI